MKHKQINYFDVEEKETIESIEGAFDRGVPVSDKKLADSMEKAAKNTLKQIRKTSQLNMRVNPDDVSIIKAKAQKIGIPYQTYISLILRQVAQGKIQVSI